MIGETEQQVRRGLHSSLISIAANFILAISKCLTGFVGHSFALVADGIESLSDVFSSAVVYFGLRFAIKPPDKEHPYGHGKAEPVAAAIVSLAMGAAAIAIAVESISLIRTPHSLPETLWVLIVVFAAKLVLSRYVSSVAKDINSTAVRGDAWHHFSDAITSVFAFVGISAALWTRNPSADDWAALCAAPVILWSALASAPDSTRRNPGHSSATRDRTGGAARRSFRSGRRGTRKVLRPQSRISLLRRSSRSGRRRPDRPLRTHDLPSRRRSRPGRGQSSGQSISAYRARRRATESKPQRNVEEQDCSMLSLPQTAPQSQTCTASS